MQEDGGDGITGLLRLESTFKIIKSNFPPHTVTRVLFSRADRTGKVGKAKFKIQPSSQIKPLHYGIYGVYGIIPQLQFWTPCFNRADPFDPHITL